MTREAVYAPGARVRHKKRGTEYEVIGVGKIQAENWLDYDAPMGSVDMREVVIYRSVDDGSLWVRPREEFEDGRFKFCLALAKRAGGRETMIDIIERIRRHESHVLFGPLFIAAADRIEALERENAELRAAKEQARREALEEAAKVAERCGRPVGASDGCTYVPGTSIDAAKAIRSLIQTEREDK